jgi:hypothetical protein
MEKELNDLLRQVELIRQRESDAYFAWHKAKVDAINADGECRKLHEDSAVIENQIKELKQVQNEIHRKMSVRRKLIENNPELTALYVAHKEAVAAKESMEQRLKQAFNPGYRDEDSG